MHGPYIFTVNAFGRETTVVQTNWVLKESKGNYVQNTRCLANIQSMLAIVCDVILLIFQVHSIIHSL